MDPAKQQLALRFGSILRKKRKDKELTQKEFAKRASISRTMLVSLEQGGSTCRLATFVRIALALGMEPPDLLKCGSRPR